MRINVYNCARRVLSPGQNDSVNAAKDDFEFKPYTTVASNISALNKSMLCTLHSVLSMVCTVELWIAVKSADPLLFCSARSTDYIHVCISMLYA